MYVALSDLLTCPRCGPTYGLVLMPESVTDRRVREGVLGCANCRERYPVSEWVVDLRVPGVGGVGGSDWSGGSVEEPAVRLAALMGLAEARGTVLVAGPAVSEAAALSSLVEEIEVIGVAGSPGVSRGDAGSVAGEASSAEVANPAGAEGGSVSRLLASSVLPVRSGSMRAVALTGGWSGVVDEGIRVLAPLGHLVLDPAPAYARERAESAGLAVVLEEGSVLVVARHA